jgi:two-component system, OmpR family, sensor histidine kinase TctE
VIRFAREQRSLFGEILDWMLAPLLLLWPMSVALTWVVAQGIANRPYDRNLGDTAVILARHVSDLPSAAPGQPTMRLDVQPQALDLLRSDDVDRIYFQVLGRRGEVVSGDRDMPVPDALEVGGGLQFRDESIQGDSVRVAYLWLPSADPSQPPRAMVQVAETLNKRSQLATEIIKGVILPQFVILPLAVVLVWFALARGMAPLNALQQRIRKRESHDLSPLDEQDVPEEVSPLVGAINDLLARLDVSIAAQKHFLADAAHQLKTPLAGLRTQAELAQRELDGGDAASARRSLQNIARSSQRAAHMVTQLLAMARAEDEEMRLLTQDVNLLRLAQDVVGDFFGRASDKTIDLGLEGADAQAALVPVWVRGQPVLVRELLRNLVDNALHHAPSGGRVTVRVLHDPFGQVAVLQVEDDGPGVSPAERDLVFQAFYRAPDNRNEGSGLGLAIVKEIAQSHGATVALEEVHPRAGQRGGAVAGVPNVGARFTVRFKAAMPSSKSGDAAPG